MVQVLKAFGFDLPEITPKIFQDQDKIIRMGNPPIRIEVITRIDGVEFDACNQKRLNAEIDGVDVNIIDLEHLKLNKRASGRYKDLDDLEHLP